MNSKLNLDLPNPSLISTIPTETSTAVEGVEVFSAQPLIRSGVSEFDDLENPVPLEKRDIAPAETPDQKLLEKIFLIFSLLGKTSQLLETCKTLRSYSLNSGKYIVAFKYDQYLDLAATMQTRVIELIQQIGVKLMIKSIQEVENVFTFIAEQPAVFGEKENPRNKITQLNLSQIELTQDNWETILNFINECKFLSTLSLGNIQKGANIALEDLPNLKSLSLGNIGERASFTLQNLSLENLSCGHLHLGATFDLSENSTVENLSLGNMRPRSNLVLSEKTRVKKLSIKEIHPTATVILTTGLKDLTTLSIGAIYPFAVFKLGEELTALKTLFFGNIYTTGVSFAIPPELIALEALSFQGIGTPADLTLKMSFRDQHFFPTTITIPQSLKQAIRGLTPEMEESFIQWIQRI